MTPLTARQVPIMAIPPFVSKNILAPGLDGGVYIHSDVPTTSPPAGVPMLSLIDRFYRRTVYHLTFSGAVVADKVNVPTVGVIRFLYRATPVNLVDHLL